MKLINKIKIFIAVLIIFFLILLNGQILEIELIQSCLLGLMSMLQLVFAIDYKRQKKEKLTKYAFFLSFILFLATIATAYTYLSMS